MALVSPAREEISEKALPVLQDGWRKNSEYPRRVQSDLPMWSEMASQQIQLCPCTAPHRTKSPTS